MDMSTYFFGTVWSLRIWRVGIWGVIALRSDCCFLPSLNSSRSREQIKREAAEWEKESAEKQVKELEQNVEDQERVFQRLRTEMTEEMRESEKASAGTEGRAHFAVGWGGSCSVSLRTLTGGTSRSRAPLFLL